MDENYGSFLTTLAFFPLFFALILCLPIYITLPHLQPCSLWGEAGVPSKTFSSHLWPLFILSQGLVVSEQVLISLKKSEKHCQHLN